MDNGGINLYPFVNYTDMRVNEYYKIYYINWARNIFTGILPIASLIIFNQLVYKKLVKRRNMWKQGKPISFSLIYIFPLLLQSTNINARRTQKILSHSIYTLLAGTKSFNKQI